MEREKSKGFEILSFKPEPIPDRHSMDIETKGVLFAEIQKDPYYLHRRFKTELIALAEKFDDLDHDLSGGTDLQDSVFTAAELGRSMQIPAVETRDAITDLSTQPEDALVTGFDTQDYRDQQTAKTEERIRTVDELRNNS